jgi:capsular polysaccharide export protein
MFVASASFLTNARVRRILDLAGWGVRVGAPGEGDVVGVWGQSPTAPRGEKLAAWRDAPIVRVEDALLRSLCPGRTGEPTLGLTIDTRGVHFDPANASDLEVLLATHPLDDTTLLNRARLAEARIRRAHLSKYSAVDPALPVPEPGFVLVIDQTRGDAAVTASGASEATFRDMLIQAQTDFPACPIVIKTHPETAGGHRSGYFGPDDASDRVTLVSDPVSPWRLFEHAAAVYTVSSGLGFEAIYGGHKPHVFGQPFYAGWGLTQDRDPIPRRGRPLTRAQLFAAAMILYPVWYDPYRDRLCELEDVVSTLESQARAWREDRAGWVAAGMKPWKRPAIQGFFGREKRVQFAADAGAALTRARKEGRRAMAWARHAGEVSGVARVEDGFLRSAGLGAALTPPLSLAIDDLGIYYDPTCPSRLEQIVAESTDLLPVEIERAERLVASITALGLTKYNIGGDPLPELPEGRRLLVPGQVEDDASILRGTGAVRTNAALLRETRSRNPDAVILYKPHPDVAAGLRLGGVSAEDLAQADIVTGAETDELLGAVDEVWTMTSTLGFEALLRGVPVTTLGAPFYAGWGLTTDLGAPPDRRTARPSLAQFAHACLVGYPRYRDPVTGLACSPEIIVERIVNDDIPSPGRTNRFLSRLQSLVASLAPSSRAR